MGGSLSILLVQDTTRVLFRAPRQKTEHRMQVPILINIVACLKAEVSGLMLAVHILCQWLLVVNYLKLLKSVLHMHYINLYFGKIHSTYRQYSILGAADNEEGIFDGSPAVWCARIKKWSVWCARIKKWTRSVYRW
jgi:hypothetical protein